MKAEANNLFGDSNIHYLGQEKSNSLRGSTEILNIHYLGQIQNLGQNISKNIELNSCGFIRDNKKGPLNKCAKFHENALSQRYNLQVENCSSVTCHCEDWLT